LQHQTARLGIAGMENAGAVYHI